MKNTPEQIQAIRSLERALKKVADSGLSLVGMGNEIYAGQYKDIADPISRFKNQDKLITINDHGAYKDSGGW